MVLSYSLDLHGVKESSGIDIMKIFKDATIGFQIKTKSDDISENMILSEIAKAQNWKIAGFVLIYARSGNKKLETSIQAAYHNLKLLKDTGKMYSAIIEPELLAEIFRTYSINIVD